METPGLPPVFTPDLLNLLFRQYNKAADIEKEEWLTAELERQGLAEHRHRLGEVFATVLGAGYVFLSAYPDGTRNSGALWAAHDAQIRLESPWLDDGNFDWACYWSRYYAWHDGLVRS